MASNAEDLLSCAICLEHFQDPRLLHCGHTFCLKCLTGYHVQGQTHIPCPQCRAATQLHNGQVNSLPKDFRIGQFQDVISQSEDKKKTQKTFCILCKERNETTEANRLCTECKRDFCEQCAQRHSSVPAFKQHSIITMPTGNMASLRYCGSHSDELLMYNCLTCDQFVCSLCITDTHNTCEVHSVSESLSQNHEKLNKVLAPLLTNEQTLNAHLRDYNITIQKLNETHDAIDRQAKIIQEHVQKARHSLLNSLSAYEQEQVAKLLTSLSADGSMDVHSYKQLCTEIHQLSTSNDPWTVAMHTKDLVTKANNINQSLERLKKSRGDQELQYMKFSPTPDSVELGTLNLAPIDPKESASYPGYQKKPRRSQDGVPQQEVKPIPGQDVNQKVAEWSPSFSLKTEGSSIGQINKPTDVTFMNRDTIAVSDYGNSRYTIPSTVPAYLHGYVTSANYGLVAPPSTNHMTLPVANPIGLQLPIPMTTANTPVPVGGALGTATGFYPPTFATPGGMKRTQSDSDLPPKKALRAMRTKRKKDFMNSATPGPSSLLPVMAPPVSMPTGIKVTGLPATVDKQEILEVFGFDVVQQVIVKDQVASLGWGRVAWILYQTPLVASTAVQQFDQKNVLGSVVQVRLCDASVIAHETNTPDAAEIKTPSVKQEATAVPLIDLTEQTGNETTASTTTTNSNFTSASSTITSMTIGQNLPLNLTTHKDTSTSITPTTVAATFPNNFIDQLMLGASDQSYTNQTNPPAASTSRDSSTSETAKPLKFKILRSKLESSSQDTYTIVPFPPGTQNMTGSLDHSSAANDTNNGQQDLLSDLPEPNQNVDEAFDAQSLINNIQYSGVTAHASTEQDAELYNDWTCPNCDMFNLYTEQHCGCGTAKPNP